eukprot:scaffold166328_cov29-Attheya_sp.AAC.1
MPPFRWRNHYTIMIDNGGSALRPPNNRLKVVTGASIEGRHTCTVELFPIFSRSSAEMVVLVASSLIISSRTKDRMRFV